MAETERSHGANELRKWSERYSSLEKAFVENQAILHEELTLARAEVIVVLKNHLLNSIRLYI